MSEKGRVQQDQWFIYQCSQCKCQSVFVLVDNESLEQNLPLVQCTRCSCPSLPEAFRTTLQELQSPPSATLQALAYDDADERSRKRAAGYVKPHVLHPMLKVQIRRLYVFKCLGDAMESLLLQSVITPEHQGPLRIYKGDGFRYSLDSADAKGSSSGSSRVFTRLRHILAKTYTRFILGPFLPLVLAGDSFSVLVPLLGTMAIFVAANSLSWAVYDASVLWIQNVSQIAVAAMVVLLVLMVSCVVREPGYQSKQYNTPHKGTAPFLLHHHQEEEEEMNGRDEIIVKRRGFEIRQKYCASCGWFRSERMSHCGVCDCCVDRQDHHCWVLGTCIGRRNHGLFVLTLAVALALLPTVAVATAIVGVFYVPSTFSPIQRFGCGLLGLGTCVVCLTITYQVWLMNLGQWFNLSSGRTSRERLTRLWGPSIWDSPYNYGERDNVAWMISEGTPASTF